MLAADLANRVEFVARHGLAIWLDPLAQRADYNRLMWERLRGIAFDGWEVW